MKNKHGKGTAPLRSVTELLDGQVEPLAGKEPSWLPRTLGLDEDTRLSQARAMASEIFLQSWLFPLVDGRKLLNESTIVDLLVEFKRSRSDLDVAFEMAQVMARILSRFECHVIEELEDAWPVISDSLEREMELFTSLAELDFKSIDQAVRDRLHSG